MCENNECLAIVINKHILYRYMNCIKNSLPYINASMCRRTSERIASIDNCLTELSIFILTLISYINLPFALISVFCNNSFHTLALSHLQCAMHFYIYALLAFVSNRWYIMCRFSKLQNHTHAFRVQCCFNLLHKIKG